MGVIPKGTRLGIHVEKVFMRKSFTLDGLRAILAFDNWPTVLFARLFDRGTGFVAYRKNGFDILIDHRGGDENGTRSCIASNMYRRYLPFFDLPRPARVLDLGANGGGFPLMLRIEGIQLARVVSVEMNPLTFLRLQLNLVTNLGAAAIAINAAACGMSTGPELSFKTSRGGTAEGIYTSSADSSGPHVLVQKRTLEALYDEHFENELLDICKVDIEGAEYDVFTSCPDGLICKIRYIVIEFHDPAQTPAFVERITDLGFTEILAEAGRSQDEFGDVRAFRGPAA
jgi:FkbM family methyltransferase